MNASTIAQAFRYGLHQLPKLSPAASKAVHAILQCRTQSLGGTRLQCDCCEARKVVYHSCRNRHCPQCQSSSRILWVDKQLRDLLPVGYFHVVFTLPHQLNQFALRNKTVFYNIMFRAVKETLCALAQDPKRLGADIGAICVLHTWGQNLMDHPHIHCIVPAGGYHETSRRWKSATTAKGEPFLFPVNVMRARYRGRFMTLFNEALRQGDMKLHGALQRFEDTSTRKAFIDKLYRRKWVVYVKQPFASAHKLVKYLGNYTHRVAISNQRILKVTATSVTFSYTDYRDNCRRKTMTLHLSEFMRRFLLHVLPDGFRRIRYYGFLAARARKKRLGRCREVFRIKSEATTRAARNWTEIVKELMGIDPFACRVCRRGHMHVVEVIPKMPMGAMSQ